MVSMEFAEGNSPEEQQVPAYSAALCPSYDLEGLWEALWLDGTVKQDVSSQMLLALWTWV
jgi:hypothetical protein